MKEKGKDCPHCGMPDVGGDVLAIMNLHARCRSNKCLPVAGGLLDQPAYLMDLFDIIDGAQESNRRKLRELAEAESLKEQMAARLARA